MNGQNFVVIYRDAVIVILSDGQHQLFSKVVDQRGRHVKRICEEHPEIAHRHDL
jgi:hypothetical protein